jgi:hypothetical protein
VRFRLQDGDCLKIRDPHFTLSIETFDGPHVPDSPWTLVTKINKMKMKVNWMVGVPTKGQRCGDFPVFTILTIYLPFPLAMIPSIQLFYLMFSFLA